MPEPNPINPTFMHGIVYLQLKKFLQTATDPAKLKTIYEEAGVANKFTTQQSIMAMKN
jgi:hypothetical protein